MLGGISPASTGKATGIAGRFLGQSRSRQRESLRGEKSGGESPLPSADAGIWESCVFGPLHRPPHAHPKKKTLHRDAQGLTSPQPVRFPLGLFHRPIAPPLLRLHAGREGFGQLHGPARVLRARPVQSIPGRDFAGRVFSARLFVRVRLSPHTYAGLGSAAALTASLLRRRERKQRACSEGGVDLNGRTRGREGPANNEDQPALEGRGSIPVWGRGAQSSRLCLQLCAPLLGGGRTTSNPSAPGKTTLYSRGSSTFYVP